MEGEGGVDAALTGGGGRPDQAALTPPMTPSETHSSGGREDDVGDPVQRITEERSALYRQLVKSSEERSERRGVHTASGAWRSSVEVRER